MSLLFPSILTAIESKARRQNFLVIISSPSGDVDEEKRQMIQLLGMGIQGFIVALRYHSIQLQPYLQNIYQQRLPVVFISYVHDFNQNYVGSDHHFGGYTATSHLIKLGYRRIAYVTSETDNPPSDLRFKGYREAFIDNHFNLDDLCVISTPESSGNRFEDGYEIAKKLTCQNHAPEAVFAFSDLLAPGIKKYFSENDFFIPRDLAVVGFDDIQAAAHAAIPLTTVRQPMQQIGRYAFLTLLQKLRGDSSVTRLLLMPELIVRQSCGAKQGAGKQD